MKDEISAARRKKRRRYNLRRFFWFIVVVVLIIVSVSVANSVTKTTFLDIGDFFTVLFKGGNYPVSLGSSIPIQASKMSMSYAVLTKNELMTYSSGGGQLLNVAHSLPAPCISTSNSRVVLYSPGSRDIYVYNRSSLLAELRADYAVVDADVANGGTLALLTQSERYACQLDIYKGGSYEKLMTWYGASGFPLSAVIRPDGRTVAAARVVASGGGIATVIAVIDINGKAELYECIIPELVNYMFFDGDALIAVTDREAFRIDRSGQLQQKYDFGHMPVLSIVRDNGPVAVALGDNSRPAVNAVVVLDKNLGEQCYIKDCGAVRDMYITGNRLYILGDRVISEYNLRGELLRRYETDTDTVMVLNINGIVAILPDSAKRINTYIREE